MTVIGFYLLKKQLVSFLNRSKLEFTNGWCHEQLCTNLFKSNTLKKNNSDELVQLDTTLQITNGPPSKDNYKLTPDYGWVVEVSMFCISASKCYLPV